MYSSLKRLLTLVFSVLVVSVLAVNVTASSISAEEDSIGLLSSSFVVINRVDTAYSQTAPYRTLLQSRMNCYGYALHVYSRDIASYLQQPGEFARDGVAYGVNADDLEEAINESATADELLDYIQSEIYADFNGLGYNDSSEWVIYETTYNASIPSGYRMIALAVGLGEDYHFYMRHSDGTWSHKPGLNAVRATSFTSGTTITDENIYYTLYEGIYNDGVRYYLIKKSAIIDYPHGNGHGSSTYTSTLFMDTAGDTMNKARSIIVATSGRFDYSGDVDFYAFTPSTTGTYVLTSSLSSSTYNMQMRVYDTYGTMIAEETSAGNPTISIYMVAGYRYFIEVYDDNGYVVNYTLDIDLS